MEEAFDFRKRLLQVHKRNRKNPEAYSKTSGRVVDGSWEILYPRNAGRVVQYAARDLRDYFDESMDVHLRVLPVDMIAEAISDPAGKIILATVSDDASYAPDTEKPSSYRLVVGDGIIVCGIDGKGVAQGCYFIEDLMNLNEGPVIELRDVTRSPVFSPRMTHSGYGVDWYPDAYLRTVAHFGIDAVIVFVKGVHKSSQGYLDFNELIYRAAGFGVDVYAYSYFVSERHPEDSDALEHYESTYGRLFSECPGLKGVVLVNESVGFPSKDPRTTGRPSPSNSLPENDIKKGGKPNPSYYPASDWPLWLEMIKGVIRSKSPDADIVFWTYTWGDLDAEPRLALIRNMPSDIALLPTFEMFETFDISDTAKQVCVDYTLSFAGPGKYFTSEAAEAAGRGMRLYTMSNTGGLTWDFGVIPYQPAAYQWKRRYDGLLAAHEKWGLTGLMESHHYGFYPSFVAELAKWSFWTPAPDFDAIIRSIAARDFGSEYADRVLEALRLYSEGIRFYVSTAEDQYGPFRIGPAYPLLLRKTVSVPSTDYATNGSGLCLPMYHYIWKNTYRLRPEYERLSEMKRLNDAGNEILEEVIASRGAKTGEAAAKLLNLGRFISNSVQTALNAKQWLLYKIELHEIDHGLREGERGGVLRKMASLARDEIENARNTIPLVGIDSRLGYEPSMDYVCDRRHLEWKMRVMADMLERELQPTLDEGLPFDYDSCEYARHRFMYQDWF